MNGGRDTASARCRLESIAYAHRAVCSCDWTSKFFPSAQLAREAWERHRAKRNHADGARLSA